MPDFRVLIIACILPGPRRPVKASGRDLALGNSYRLSAYMQDGRDIER
jgi:hypothetical protein